MILDTNALSAWADGNPACRPFFEQARRIVVPVIVLGEYLYGIRQSRFRDRYDGWLASVMPLVELASVTPVTADHYASLRLHLKSHGTPIPANDVWIAALVRELRLPLLSNDQHFDQCPDLQRLTF
ncbi:MAG: type II toxin-antitoxin system VapC family toxin [Verrucomicrobiae bacterium]|nr:type II toxin-antitoxin system VapC family toxin [Verrucomicrobiae bacterium]MCP5532202.1 type II toxin-antitoxin system VapC family toxin [Akkermansiaceae bacterium]